MEPGSAFLTWTLSLGIPVSQGGVLESLRVCRRNEPEGPRQQERQKSLCVIVTQIKCLEARKGELHLARNPRALQGVPGSSGGRVHFETQRKFQGSLKDDSETPSNRLGNFLKDRFLFPSRDSSAGPLPPLPPSQSRGLAGVLAEWGQEELEGLGMKGERGSRVPRSPRRAGWAWLQAQGGFPSRPGSGRPSSPLRLSVCFLLA